MTYRLPTLILTLALLASACGSDTAESTSPPAAPLSGTAAEIYPGECVDGTGDKISIYSGRSEDLIAPVLEAFTCETGVEVEVRWGSSGDLAFLIGEEGERTIADVFLSRSPGPVGFLEARNLLGTLDDDVTSLVDPAFQSANGTWVGFSGRQRVMVYNADLVSADDLPNSVFDLTGEAWRGKVAIAPGNGSFVDWFTVLRDQNGTEAATAWLDAMVANDARPYDGNRGIVDAVARGEIEAGLVNHYYNFQAMAADGDHRGRNHVFAANDIGGVVIITAATVTASTDNPEASNDLVAYLLSAPVQQYLTNDTLEYPLAADVAPAPALPALDALEIGSLDFDALGGGYEETTAIIDDSGIANQ